MGLTSGHLKKPSFSVMAASATCSNPHVLAYTLRFSARDFLALTKKSWFLEVPFRMRIALTIAKSLKELHRSRQRHRLPRCKNSKASEGEVAGQRCLRNSRICPSTSPSRVRIFSCMLKLLMKTVDGWNVSDGTDFRMRTAPEIPCLQLLN